MVSFADYMHALINEINPVSITDQTRTQMKSHPKYYIISLILKCINKYIPEYYVFGVKISTRLYCNYWFNQSRWRKFAPSSWGLKQI